MEKKISFVITFVNKFDVVCISMCLEVFMIENLWSG